VGTNTLSESQVLELIAVPDELRVKLDAPSIIGEHNPFVNGVIPRRVRYGNRDWQKTQDFLGESGVMVRVVGGDQQCRRP